MRLRPLTEADIPFAMSLKDAAGWNQTPEDWKRFVGFRPQGCFLAEWEGEPAGTVTTIDYGGAFGWIGMLLVAAHLRGRGIGKRLLEAAIESLATHGCETVKLDATPAGRRVYLPMGFVDEAALERRVRPASVGRVTTAKDLAGPDVTLERATPQDLHEIIAFDARTFGQARPRVLEAWPRGASRYAMVARLDGNVIGYSLGRSGSRCDHVGPIVASDITLAAALLFKSLEAAGERPVLVDVFTQDAAWLKLLDQLGFAVERGFTRMHRGPNRFPGCADLYWTIAGPEVG